MPIKLARVFPRFHLVTLIVLMLASGILMFANFNARFFSLDLESGGTIWQYGGWPFPSWDQIIQFNGIVEDGEFSHDITRHFLNALAAFTILALTALVCEFLLRRTDKKRAQ